MNSQRHFLHYSGLKKQYTTRDFQVNVMRKGFFFYLDKLLVLIIDRTNILPCPPCLPKNL